MNSILFIILQAGQIESQLEKITNPILALLLIVLGGLIWFLMKQSSAKDKYIKELNSNVLEYATNSLTVLKNIENSIEGDKVAHEGLRELLKENNLFLQSIITSISKL